MSSTTHTLSQQQSFILLLLFIGFAILIVWFNKRRIRKRRELLDQISTFNGFKPHPSPSEFLYQLPRIDYLSPIRSQGIINLVKIPFDEIDLFFLDYYFVKHRSRSQRGKNRTRTERVEGSALIGVFPDQKLPHFTVSPESIFHKLHELAGMKDIDFNQHPEFSKKYFLNADNEPAARKLFTPPLIQTLTAIKHPFFIEGNQTTVLIRPPFQGFIREKGILSFIDTGKQILTQFRKSTA